MSEIRVMLAVCCLVLSLGLCAGCNSGTVETGSVAGSVTMDGAPVAGARVVFTPEQGRRSVGATDREGKYELAFTEDQKGAVLGTHSVSIEWTGEDADEDEMAEAVDAEPGGGLKEVEIPAKYNTATTLTAQVDAGSNVRDFDLTSE